MKLITKLFIFALLIACPTFALADNSFPSFPMAFWGTATLDGQPLASGTQIEAFCNNSLVGSVTMTESGIYGYIDSTKNKLLVSGCSGNILFEYLPSGTTTPLIGGNQIQYTTGFQSGTTVNQNLAFVDTQSCGITNGTGTQTWNGSAWGDCTWVSCNSGYTQSGNTCIVVSSGGGGGGGGGGGSPITPVVTTTDNTNPAWDSTNVGISDLSIMMAEWGKITSGLSADLNHDNKIDILDFSMLMGNWNGK